VNAKLILENDLAIIPRGSGLRIWELLGRDVEAINYQEDQASEFGSFLVEMSRPLTASEIFQVNTAGRICIPSRCDLAAVVEVICVVPHVKKGLPVVSLSCSLCTLFYYRLAMHPALLLAALLVLRIISVNVSSNCQ
jgi:hypothetical protein